MFSNQHQNIPEVFQQIMENDKILQPMLERIIGYDAVQEHYLSQKEWINLRRRLFLKRDLIRAAEAILKWNTDKGKVG